MAEEARRLNPVSDEETAGTGGSYAPAPTDSDPVAPAGSIMSAGPTDSDSTNPAENVDITALADNFNSVAVEDSVGSGVQADAISSTAATAGDSNAPDPSVLADDAETREREREAEIMEQLAALEDVEEDLDYLNDANYLEAVDRLTRLYQACYTQATGAAVLMRHAAMDLPQEQKKDKVVKLLTKALLRDARIRNQKVMALTGVILSMLKPDEEPPYPAYTITSVRVALELCLKTVNGNFPA